MREPYSGRTNLTAILVLLGLVVAGVWVWKRLTPATQDAIVEQAVPVAAGLAALLVVAWRIVRAVSRRRWRAQRRAQLIKRFQKETAHENRLELAFELIEVNEYEREGLEPVASALHELLATTLKKALGDKQHRVRGMAASHLGVLRDPASVPLLLAALDDDHAYVRSSAALGLGRLRATEAKAKLQTMSVDDWDQTVRSRAREAVERIP
jgi:HEAT repeat protein